MPVHDCSIEGGHCCIFFGLRRAALKVMTKQACNCPCHNGVEHDENDMRKAIVTGEAFDECFIEAQAAIYERRKSIEARVRVGAMQYPKALRELYESCTAEMIKLRKKLESM